MSLLNSTWKQNITQKTHTHTTEGKQCNCIGWILPQLVRT